MEDKPNSQPNNTNQNQSRSRRPQGPRPAQAGAPRPPRPQGQGGQRPQGQRPNNNNRSGGQSATTGARQAGQVSNRVTRERIRAGQNLVPKMPNPRALPVNKSVFNGAGGEQATAVQGKPRIANQIVKQDTIRVIPLGGLGEIGKNMMAIEHGNDIIIIDMGFAFPESEQPGIDYIIPDVTYLEKNKHKVRAIVITHGHMDHIGAAGYMIPKFPVPIYGSRLSLAFVEKQIEEYKLQTSPQFRVLDCDKHERVQIGSFNLELVRVTHTISDSTAVVLRTAAGTIINTGDWRHDPTPLDNKPMDMPRLKEIGEEGVLLLMSDSTSCDRAGHNPTEQIVEPVLEDLFGRSKNRIIISTFSSSITRVQLIIDQAHKAKRKLALVGRSTLTNIELCVKLGYVKIPPGLIIRVQEANKYSDNEVVVLCTGSQGEENSALVRMSTGDHPNIKIKAGDTIILSSSIIPGNEKSVVKLIDNLMREGAQIFSRMTEGIREHGPVHVGGHGHKGDVGDLVALVKPKYYMPIHGEFHHLVYSAEAANENGVAKENCFIMDNGDVLEVSQKEAKRAGRVPSGNVMIDGHGVGDVEQVVLRDRLAMASEGIFTIIATVDRKTSKLVTSPDIISRGFIYMKESEELVKEARQMIRNSFDRRNNREPLDWTKFKLQLRDQVADFLYAKTKRNPMVIVVVNEV